MSVKYIYIIMLLTLEISCFSYHYKSIERKNSKIEHIEYIAIDWLRISSSSMSGERLRKILRKGSQTSEIVYIHDSIETTNMNLCLKKMQLSKHKYQLVNYPEGDCRIAGYIYRTDKTIDSFSIQVTKSIIINNLRYEKNEVFMNYILSHIPNSYKEDYKFWEHISDSIYQHNKTKNKKS